MDTFVSNQMSLNKMYRDAAKELFNKPFNNDLTAAELNQIIAHVLKNEALSPQIDRARERYSDRRVAVYLSIEILPGRIVLDALLNAGLLEDTKAAFAVDGVNIHKLEEVKDPATGNGGLGRLAACFLDSAAALGYPVCGAGPYYRFGLFEQSFNEFGRQVELKDDWTKDGDPWFEPDYDHTYVVNFQNTSVRMVPMRLPIVGYVGGTTNELILWKAEPIPGITNELASKISDYLYPSDGDDFGKFLRISQEYSFASAQLQMLFDTHIEKHGNLDHVEDYYRFQMNDTHPVFAVLEFIRLLQKHGYSFDVAFEKAKNCFAYTNHTVLTEALEKWEIRLFKNLLPDLFKVVQDINQKLCDELCVQDRFKKREYRNGAWVMETDWQRIREYEVFDERKGLIYMAKIACYIAYSINGVAEIHTEILKAKTLKNWYELYPWKFNNKTNGVTPRRWVLGANPELADLITRLLSTDDWIRNLPMLEAMCQYEDNQDVLSEFAAIKHSKKVQLAEVIKKHEGVEIDPDSIFYVQVKRIHMYKRQSMNVLRILNIYDMLKRGELPNFYKSTFIIGGKAAASYHIAKEVIAVLKFIQNRINNDPDVNDKMKVVFLTNYNVSYGEEVYPGADVSEQISMAGKEASGTGNMKFMMNGAVTLGTEDGANIEIFRAAGHENNYPFGLTVEEFKKIENSYRHSEVLAENADLLRVFNYLTNEETNGVGFTYWDFVNVMKFNDEYFAVLDLRDYMRATFAINADYAREKATGDMTNFTLKQFRNTAHSGIFSSDHTIEQYAQEIWHIERVD